MKMTSNCRPEQAQHSSGNGSNRACAGTALRLFRPTVGSFILFGLAAIGPAFAHASPPAELRVGVGRAAITPEGPIWQSGYAARTRPSDGVVHDLWAKALVIEDAGHPPAGRGRLVLVTTDLVGLPHELSEEVAAQAEDEVRPAAVSDPA